MSNDNLSAHLLRLEVFQGLTHEQLSEIARRAERIVFKPNQLLIADGEPGDAAVLVISGNAVRVQSLSETSGASGEPVEAGSLLGEMTMLIDTEYSSTVMAIGPVRALRIRRDAMIDMMLADRTLAEHFVQTIVRRLGRLASELRQIESTLDSTEQICSDLGNDAEVADLNARDLASRPSYTTAIAPPTQA